MKKIILYFLVFLTAFVFFIPAQKASADDFTIGSLTGNSYILYDFDNATILKGKAVDVYWCTTGCTTPNSLNFVLESSLGSENSDGYTYGATYTTGVSNGRIASSALTLTGLSAGTYANLYLVFVTYNTPGGLSTATRDGMFTLNYASVSSGLSLSISSGSPSAIWGTFTTPHFILAATMPGAASASPDSFVSPWPYSSNNPVTLITGTELFGKGVSTTPSAYDMWFCKTSGDPPPCTNVSGDLACDSLDVASGTQTNCEYNPIIGDAGTLYGFVCDTGTTTNCSNPYPVNVTISVPTITVTVAGASGSISWSGNNSTTTSKSVLESPGNNETFNFNPGSGNYTSNVVVDGVSLGYLPSYTFTNIQSNHTVSVTFSQNVVTFNSLSVSSSSNEKVTFTASVSQSPGASDPIALSICKNEVSGFFCSPSDWCLSGQGPSTVSCTYTASVSDLGTQNYYAFMFNEDSGIALSNCPGNLCTSGTFTISSSLPVKSNFNPVSGSTIFTSTPTIGFNLNEDGDCYASTTNGSYNSMSGAINCTGDGTKSITCPITTLLSGTESVYVACEDTLNSKDSTGTQLTYTVSSSQTHGFSFLGALKFLGSFIFK